MPDSQAQLEASGRHPTYLTQGLLCDWALIQASVLLTHSAWSRMQYEFLCPWCCPSSVTALTLIFLLFSLQPFSLMLSSWETLKTETNSRVSMLGVHNHFQCNNEFSTKLTSKMQYFFCPGMTSVCIFLYKLSGTNFDVFFQVLIFTDCP